MSKTIMTTGQGLTIYHNGENYEDLRFPAAGINPPGAASDPDRDTGDGCLLFDKASTEVIAGQAQAPHKWKKGSAMIPHIHWQPTTTGAGNVLWRLSVDMASINGEFAGSFTDIDILAAADGSANKHQIASFGNLNMKGMAVSAMIKWKVSRIGGDATDTYDADAKLLEVDFHYLINSVGSGLEYPKY
jgi:hypothetical protein